jgi:hypothetical protein
MGEVDAEFPPRHNHCAAAVVVSGDACLLVRQARGGLAGQWSIDKRIALGRFVAENPTVRRMSTFPDRRTPIGARAK